MCSPGACPKLQEAALAQAQDRGLLRVGLWLSCPPVSPKVLSLPFQVLLGTSGHSLSPVDSQHLSGAPLRCLRQVTLVFYLSSFSQADPGWGRCWLWHSRKHIWSRASQNLRLQGVEWTREFLEETFVSLCLHFQVARWWWGRPTPHPVLHPQPLPASPESAPGQHWG